MSCRLVSVRQQQKRDAGPGAGVPLGVPNLFSLRCAREPTQSLPWSDITWCRIRSHIRDIRVIDADLRERRSVCGSLSKVRQTITVDRFPHSGARGVNGKRSTRIK